MAGFLLLNAIGLGGLMVMGNYLFPGSPIMWFMSDQQGMVLWREAILAGLILLALVRLYFDNRMVRALWAVASVPLLWMGYQYFMDNAAFVMDSFFLLLAGISFAIAALQTADEPRPVVRTFIAAAWRRGLLAHKRLEIRLTVLNQQSTLHVVNWQNMQNTEHRMLLRRPIRT